MAPQSVNCRTCLKKFGSGDLSVKLSFFDDSNNITIRDKLGACVPELMDLVDSEDVLCTTCNYMLGISYKFRVTCLQANKISAKRITKASNDANPFTIQFKISSKDTCLGQNYEFSFKSQDADKSSNSENNFSGAFVAAPNSKTIQIAPTSKSFNAANLSKTLSQNCYLKTDKGFVPLVFSSDDDVINKTNGHNVDRPKRYSSESRSVSPVRVQRTTRNSVKLRQEKIEENPTDSQEICTRSKRRKISVNVSSDVNPTISASTSTSTFIPKSSVASPSSTPTHKPVASSSSTPTNKPVASSSSTSTHKPVASSSSTPTHKPAAPIPKPSAAPVLTPVPTHSNDSNSCNNMDEAPNLDHFDNMSSSSFDASDNNRETDCGRNSPLLEILSEDTMAFEERTYGSLQAENRLLLEQIIQCNGHLQKYTAEQFECSVEIEPLPNSSDKKGKKLEYLCQCNHCGITFTSKIKLLTHIRRHFEYKPHQCKICNRRYYELHDLKVHMIAHEKSEQKVTATEIQPALDPSVKVKQEVVDPEETVVKTKIKTEPVDETETAAVPNPAESSVANAEDPLALANLLESSEAPSKKAVPAKSSRSATMKRMYVDMRLTEFIRDLECKFCVLTFGTEQETDIHRLKHCPICFKVFDDVEQHKVEHKSKENSSRSDYYCLDCKSFKRRPHFYDHTNVKAPKCERCGIMILKQENLLKHMALCRDYECKYCGQHFTNFNKGRTHEYHSHEKFSLKAVSCARCNVEFNTEGQLREHKIICDNVESELSDSDENKMYRCEICRSYYSHIELIQHMKLHID